MQPSFLRSAASGILIAAVLVTVVWLVARTAGDDLRVTTPGADTARKLPIFLPAVATLIAGTIAAGVALLFRRRGWGSFAFYALAVVVLIGYGAFAFGAGDTRGTSIWLNVMHVVAAAGIVPPLARLLARSV